MLLTLVLSLAVTAPPSARVMYEQKCLYCHSSEVSESRRLTEPAWRRLIEQMRKKAPLLISRGDVEVLSRYMVQTLKLGVGVARSAPVVTAPTVTTPVVAPLPELKGVPELALPESVEVATTGEAPPAPDFELEEQALGLIQQRCSKCHTLGRVYGRLDTFERSMTTLERMRLKTGSGITDDDMAVIERYLRTQF